MSEPADKEQNEIKGPSETPEKKSEHALELEKEVEEREQGERALRSSKGWYKALYEGSADGMFLLDDSGTILDGNDASLHMFGYSLEEIRGVKVVDLIHPDDLKVIPFKFQDMVRGESLRIERRMRRKDGSYIMVEVSGRRVGENLIQALHRDITERKLAEVELRQAHDELELRVEERTRELQLSNTELKRSNAAVTELVHDLQTHQTELEMQNNELRNTQLELEKSREEYADLYEFAPVGYFTLDPRGVILKANVTGARLLGKDKNHIVNKPISALLPETVADAVYFHLREVFRSKSRQICELELVKDDSISHFRLESVAVRGSEGDQDECRTIVTDITDRKEAEESLRHSEQRFRAIFEGAEDCIFLKDRSFRYIQANPACEKLSGVPVSKIVGKRHEDVFGKEDSEFIRDMDLRTLEGEMVEGEYGKTIRGMPMRFLATKTPLLEPSGEVMCILTVLHDITDRKRIEVSSLEVTGKSVSQAMRATLKQAETAAKRASTILLTGESGSGKDHLARHIHDHSDRANGPYFSINCAAIPPELAESELFGHERGAFTGAQGRKRGLLELAQGGTLLLNEIGDLSLRLQAKLLTFLDTRKFTRVGGEKEIYVNARLIAATNRDLEKAVEEGSFRKDLFYRINVVSIAVPPLRERLADVPLLVQEILAKICDEMQIHDMPVVGPPVMKALKAYHWPGNVRELRNVLERAVILSHGKEISLSGLGISDSEALFPESEIKCFSAPFPNGKSFNEMIRDLKRFLVDEALQRSGGSRQAAAKLLGISRYSLKHYMKTLGYSEGDSQE